MSYTLLALDDGETSDEITVGNGETARVRFGNFPNNATVSVNIKHNNFATPFVISSAKQGDWKEQDDRSLFVIPALSGDVLSITCKGGSGLTGILETVGGTPTPSPTPSTGEFAFPTDDINDFHNEAYNPTIEQLYIDKYMDVNNTSEAAARTQLDQTKTMAMNAFNADNLEQYRPVLDSILFGTPTFQLTDEQKEEGHTFMLTATLEQLLNMYYLFQVLNNMNSIVPVKRDFAQWRISINSTQEGFGQAAVQSLAWDGGYTGTPEGTLGTEFHGVEQAFNGGDGWISQPTIEDNGGYVYIGMNFGEEVEITGFTMTVSDLDKAPKDMMLEAFDGNAWNPQKLYQPKTDWELDLPAAF